MTSTSGSAASGPSEEPTPEGRKTALRSYWTWVQNTQDQYMIGFRPPLTVLLSLFLLVAVVTAPVGLLVTLIGSGRADGFGVGVGVAIPIAIFLASLAKHQARRRREDKWQPSK